MDKMRNKHIEEMARIEDAINRTKSPYLIKDYQKKLKKMKIELNEYDRFKGGV